MIYRVPTREDYREDIEAASEAFRRDLKRILRCEPGNCRSARPERCSCGALSRKDQAG